MSDFPPPGDFSGTYPGTFSVTYDVVYSETRNRLTNAFRMILIIPHLILANVWRSFAQVLGLLQWFTVLFSGKRNNGIWSLQNDFMGYATRVSSYGSLLFDSYPPFGLDPGATGVTYHLDYQESANRLTNALRLIWAIPAMVVTIALAIAGACVTLVSWFGILFTGRQSRGMFDFLVKVNRYSTRANAYLMLMTDTYPVYE
ncbi:unannotated protein [freshwater metagenome]|uniref:Unannotated protein n=1 Tax=freshwater metagenome TaxID=449393 RepID=A0A6J7FFY7_9ZZZZ|nr:DUF4389 domain-containing protein [Actinomycetota bacterium]